jgi:hypothetical protein
MNARRIVLAGLLAGLVLNVGEALVHGVALAQPTADAMQALGRDGVGSAAGLTMLVGITFVQALLGMLLYAAVLPRWQPGTFTAIRVGLILWTLSAVYAAVYLYAGLPGVFPNDIVWWPVAAGLIEYPVAIRVGAFVYGKVSPTPKT